MTDKKQAPKSNKGKSVGLANLKPYKPGQCGNPKGRPKGAKTGLRARLKQALGKQVTGNILAHLKQEGINLESNENAEAISAVLISQALFGDISAVKVIIDNTESPMPKDVDQGGTTINNKSITININPVKLNGGNGNGNGNGIHTRPALPR